LAQVDRILPHELLFGFCQSFRTKTVDVRKIGVHVAQSLFSGRQRVLLEVIHSMIGSVELLGYWKAGKERKRASSLLEILCKAFFTSSLTSGFLIGLSFGKVGALIPNRGN
jgi:hypothetical protein